jgi:hypothetical protein
MKKKKDRRGGPGRNQGRKTADGAHDLKRINVMLDDSTIGKANDIGEGNLSLGIRKAVAKS